MDINELNQLIRENLSSPQKSERWAMYRLITPIVDFANSELGHIMYFEFNQPSAHKTTQSVDIALLDGDGVPVMMIEAKRVDRRISAEQISKYLLSGVRGVVTNGVNWVLCLDSRSKAISIFDPKKKILIEPNVNSVIEFIQGKLSSEEDWTSGCQYIDASIKPARLSNTTKGIRKSNPSYTALDVSSMRETMSKLVTPSMLDRELIKALLDEFERQSGLPKYLRIEVRSSRISFFDTKKTSGSKRVVRIELGRQQPDILVLTALTQSEKHLSEIAISAPHDKGPHMRRFRLSKDSQAKAFGTRLAAALSVNLS